MTSAHLKNEAMVADETALSKSREALRELRFRVRRGEEKQVRRIRALKKEIARLLTSAHHVR